MHDSEFSSFQKISICFSEGLVRKNKETKENENEKGEEENMIRKRIICTFEDKHTNPLTSPTD